MEQDTYNGFPTLTGIHSVGSTRTTIGYRVCRERTYPGGVCHLSQHEQNGTYMVSHWACEDQTGPVGKWSWDCTPLCVSKHDTLADALTVYDPPRHHPHDCDRCVHLGPHLHLGMQYDLYYCPTPKDPRCADTLIARWGSEGEYQSGIPFARYGTALGEARARCEARGVTVPGAPTIYPLPQASPYVVAQWSTPGDRWICTARRTVTLLHRARGGLAVPYLLTSAYDNDVVLHEIPNPTQREITEAVRWCAEPRTYEDIEHRPTHKLRIRAQERPQCPHCGVRLISGAYDDHCPRCKHPLPYDLLPEHLQDARMSDDTDTCPDCEQEVHILDDTCPHCGEGLP